MISERTREAPLPWRADDRAAVAAASEAHLVPLLLLGYMLALMLVRNFKTFGPRFRSTEVAAIEQLATQEGCSATRLVEGLVIEGLQRRLLECTHPSVTEDEAASVRSMLQVTAGRGDLHRQFINWETGELLFPEDLIAARRAESVAERRARQQREVLTHGSLEGSRRTPEAG